MCEVFEEHAEKARLRPPLTPRLDFLRAHIHRLFELAELYPAEPTPVPTACDDGESSTPLTPEQISAWWHSEMAAREAEVAAKRKAIITAATNLHSKTKCHA